MVVLLVVAALAFLLVAPLLLHQLYRSSGPSVLTYLGSGGHTTEMMHLIEILTEEGCLSGYSVRHFSSDHRSHSLAKASGCACKMLYRARRVKQSYVTSVFTTIASFWHALALLLGCRVPEILLVNGPGTCLVLVVALRLVNLLTLTRTRVLFVESVCRVKGWSATGKLLEWMSVPLSFRGGLYRVKQWPDFRGGLLCNGLMFKQVI